MKLLKYNRIIQSLFIIILLAILIASLFNKNLLGTAIILQFFLGVSQYLSAWVIRLYFPDNRIINRYLIVASTFLAILIVGLSFFSDLLIYKVISIGCLIIIPWILAVSYWFITFRGSLKKNNLTTKS
ncbi:MAG: hypothetical protein WBA74_13435 [Cyclobacteriaceae bacterium]